MHEIKRIDHQLNASDEAVYLRLKHRHSVKNLIELGGLCWETVITMLNIEKIDGLINQEWSYSEGCTLGISCELAFILHLEETVNTEITSASQLQKLAPFSIKYMAEIEEFYHATLERRYALVLSKMLRDGDKYKNLLTLTPDRFGLPEKWKGMFGQSRTQENMIHEAMANYIDKDWISYITENTQPSSLRQIADKLEASYQDVLIASQYYA